MHNRDNAITLIKEFIIELDDITAAWEGGSVATGYSDELSDLDLYLVCKPGNQEEVLNKVTSYLEDTFGKTNMFRMQEPTLHGFSQVFFNPKNTPELFYIDFVVIGDDIEDKFIEPNRHGKASIWKENFKLNKSPRSHKKIIEISKSIYNKIANMDFVLIIELKKAIKRKVFSEAFPIYMSFITRCIVPLMNIKFRPEKVDFGLRYIYRDYPTEEYKFIENALRVSTIDALELYVIKLLTTYNQLKYELKSYSE